VHVYLYPYHRTPLTSGSVVAAAVTYSPASPPDGPGALVCRFLAGCPLGESTILGIACPAVILRSWPNDCCSSISPAVSWLRRDCCPAPPSSLWPLGVSNASPVDHIQYLLLLFSSQMWRLSRARSMSLRCVGEADKEVAAAVHPPCLLPIEPAASLLPTPPRIRHPLRRGW
jgi:hypothetical protein